MESIIEYHAWFSKSHYKIGKNRFICLDARKNKVIATFMSKNYIDGDSYYEDREYVGLVHYFKFAERLLVEFEHFGIKSINKIIKDIQLKKEEAIFIQNLLDNFYDLTGVQNNETY